MMNRHLLIYLLLALLFGGCNGWFDAKPQGDIDEERLYSDETAFLNALAGVYTQLRENTLYGEHLSVSSLEFMAQNFIPDDEAGRALANYDYSTTGNQKMIREIWRDMY
ncbi:MAG: hypothetical protein K2L23_03300, partial [Odoribacter sp.]|nr:hypothetical protein [Odoribacter sp.]